MRFSLYLLAAGTFLAAGTAHANTNDYCREYTGTVIIGGQEQPSYGTACMQPDGSWEIVKSNHSTNAPTQTIVIKEPVYTQYPSRSYWRPSSHYYSSNSSFTIRLGSSSYDRDWGHKSNHRYKFSHKNKRGHSGRH